MRTLSLGNTQRVGLAAALQHDPDVIVLDEPTNGLDPAGVIRLGEPLLARADAGAGILVARRHGADLVWAPANFGPVFRGVPRVVTVHDAIYDEVLGGLAERAQRGVTSLLMRRSAPTADRVLTVSHTAADSIRTHLGLSAEHMTVVHNGSSAPQPQSDPAAVLSSLRLPPRRAQARLVGQLLELDRGVIECRVVEDDPWCRKWRAEGVARDTVTRRLAHEPFRAWGSTILLARVRRSPPCSGEMSIWTSRVQVSCEMDNSKKYLHNCRDRFEVSSDGTTAMGAVICPRPRRSATGSYVRLRLSATRLALS